MFQGAIQSLDEVIPSNDNDNFTLEDTVPAEIDVEEDAVEKLATEQLREELWNIVGQVLKDKKKVRIFRLGYIDNLTMDQIGEQLHVSHNAIDQILRSGIRMLRCNSRTKNMGEELGIWSREYPIDAARVKRWAMEGELEFLNKREMKYAVNIGWVDSRTM